MIDEKKLIERLEEPSNYYDCDAEDILPRVISIVNQLAEEYNNKSVNGDLISRSLLMEALDKSDKDARSDADIQGYCDGWNDVVEIINEQPTVYNDGWIPCSERLPNRNEIWLGKDITDAEPREFIVMVKGAYYPTTGYYTVDGWVKDIYNKENGSGYGNEIIAWRFFPAPYQPKGE